jgi:hypothetical protein
MRHLIILRSVSVSSCFFLAIDDVGFAVVVVDEDEGDSLLVNMIRILAGLSESSRSLILSSCPSFMAKQNVEMPPIHLE